MDHIIETDRLILRPIGESDINFIQKLASRFEYNQYDRDIAQSNEKLEENCRWFIEKAKKLPKEGAIQWIVINNDVKIGEIHVICNWEEILEWEIGWHLLIEYWGNGFATEATKSIIQYGFKNFKIRRLIALLNAENIKSASLAERVGMVREGRMRENRLVKGKYYDEYIYGILKHEVVK